MNAEEAIYQVAIEWMKAANGGLSDDDVIRRNPHAPRPDLPYATVKVTTHDITVGTDETIRGESQDGEATLKQRGLRRGQVSVQTYGGVSHWISAAKQYLRTPPARSMMRSIGVRIHPDGSISEVGTIIDPEYEDRHEASFTATYELESPMLEVPAAEAVEFTAHFPNANTSTTDTLG